MAEYIERSAIKYEQWAVGPLNAPLMVVRKKTIDSIPAADVVEVKHGRWEDADDMDGVVCSVCGEDFCVLTNENERFNFCPNCGARMDGDS